MENFEFFNPTKIIFGKGTEIKTGQEVKRFAKKVLFHFGGGSIKKIGLYDRILKTLQQENIEIIELGGVKPNPRLSLVHEGIELCRKENIPFILAVGGGSVIDSAKAISIGVPYKGDVWDLYEGKDFKDIKDNLPIGVVLTFSASGSESSAGSVLTNEKGWYKRSINSSILRPKFTIMNPEITFSLSAYQTIVGIADIKPAV